MTGSSLALYSDAEFAAALGQLVERLLSPGELCPCLKPRAYLLGGQSGAGKTTLHKVLQEELKGNVVIINGDECRSMHPRYKQLDQEFGPDSVSHTAAWAGAMTGALIEELSDRGYNLVIEGTLRTSEVPLKSAELLRGKGV